MEGTSGQLNASYFPQPRPRTLNDADSLIIIANYLGRNIFFK